jgi:hypothetical protein
MSPFIWVSKLSPASATSLISHSCNSQLTHPSTHIYIYIYIYIERERERERESFFMTGSFLPVSSSWHQTPWGLWPEIFWTTNPCYIAPAWTAQKTSLPLLHVLLLPEKCVHRTVPLQGCCTVACLHSCYLAVGLHIAILFDVTSGSWKNFTMWWISD